MAASTRRSSARRKQAKPQAQKTLPAASSWRNEIIGFIMALAALFITTSLIIILPTNHSINKNLMGIVGRGIGEWLYSIAGISSFIIPLWLLAQAIHSWKLDESDGYPGSWLSLKSIFGLLSSLLLFSCLGMLIGGIPLGGLIGKTVTVPLSDSFGAWGTGILLVAGLALTIPLAIRIGISSFIGAVIGSGVFLISRLFSSLGHFWTTVKEFIGEEAEQAGAAARPLPAPRVRRNKPSEAAEEEFQAQDEISHVVVSRQTREELKKNKKAVPAAPVKTVYGEYEFPPINLLTRGEPTHGNENDEELVQLSKQIEAKLRDFSIAGRVTHVHPGPVITLFEFEPAPGVKVGRIAALQDDLAMSLKATAIRVIAPIPKRGTVGIEVPNRHRDIVRLRDVLESDAFINAGSTLGVPLGKDTYGDPVVVDISVMPHLLIAGTTGTGKSVCINALLVSLLYRASPAELGLILIDPKILELSIYEGIPHLRVPVVTVPRQAKAVLDWAVREMDRRYRLMQRFGVRNVDSYNKIAKGEPVTEVKQSLSEAVVELDDEIPAAIPAEGEEETPIAPVGEVLEPLSKIVIVIDELADLMLTVGREIEELITRLAQKARASGIHLIIATQRPSVDVITGLIKANFPARLSFRVSTRIDSRTILDSMGAERLLGKGDMLFLQPGAHFLRRVHGAFVSDEEVQQVIANIKAKSTPCYDQQIVSICEKALQEDTEAENGSGEPGNAADYDEFYDKAVELVVTKGHASTSMIQRVFRIGYNRAARIIEMMEKDGVIGPMDGVKPREVLVSRHDDN
jgi:S-DNA-T family DNA segregation ATPase FtsK/SpoIIIE